MIQVSDKSESSKRSTTSPCKKTGDTIIRFIINGRVLDVVYPSIIIIVLMRIIAATNKVEEYRERDPE